jgi:4-hydroxymandelate oxidase
MGARAVLVGRAILWGLAVDGEDGAFSVLEILRRELQEAMLLCGYGSVSEIDPSILRP